MRYFQAFYVSGAASSIDYDTGLKSTQTEKKRLITVHVEADKYPLNETCNVQGWHERAKVFEIPVRMFSVELYTAVVPVNVPQKRTAVPVDFEIPEGESFKVAIHCGATPIKIRGTYEYEIVA